MTLRPIRQAHGGEFIEPQAQGHDEQGRTMNKLQQMYNATKQVLGERKYVFILLSFALFFFALFVFIPVAATPDNTLAFQLSIFRPQDYFLMILLALLVGYNGPSNLDRYII